MEVSAVETYSNPAEIEGAHYGAKAQFVPTARGLLAVDLVRIKFEKLWVGKFTESGSRIRHVQQTPARAFLKFQTQPGAEIISDGVAVPFGSAIRHARGQEFYERTSGSIGWGIMSLPVEDMIAAGIVLAGSDLTPPRDPQIIVASPEITRLWHLHEAAVALAKDDPKVLAVPGARRGLEQSLIEAMVACLHSADVRQEKWTRRHHATIMRRFRHVLEENLEEPIYIPQICAAIGVPERTLRVCCQAYLDMGPKQFLMLRRMHLARRLLQTSAAGETTVTEVATQFGFWQLGRFAGSYRSMFGESPSATLSGSRS